MIGFHDWNGCKCSVCEKTRDDQHDWSKDCEKCSKCGKTRGDQHNWDGSKCKKCGFKKTVDSTTCGHNSSKKVQKTDQIKLSAQTVKIPEQKIVTTDELRNAAMSGNPESVRQALQGNPDLNAQSNISGFTPMHSAVAGTDSTNRQQIVEMLHAAGANLEIKCTEKGLTPLHYTALRNKPLCMETLLKCGANVHATEGNGATALHGAAFLGNVDVIRILMKYGANPNLPDNHGYTPLSLAKQKGDSKVLALLETINTSTPVLETANKKMQFVVYPQKPVSVFDLLEWQGKPIKYNGKVVGKALSVSLKNNGSLEITSELHTDYANKELGLDLELRD